MALKVFELGGPLVTGDRDSVASQINGTEVTPNITYTYITVTQNRHNDTKSKAITTDGASVPVESTGRGNKFSATSRLTASIALPLPRNIPFQWSNDWSQQETGFLEQLISGVAGGQIDTLDEVTNRTGDAVKNKVIDLVPNLGLRKYMQKSYGATANPFKEIYYNGVSFRQFSFSWEFAPQNAKEAEAIENLIYYLELSSHPELLGSTTSAYYIPDVFNVEFKGTNIPKLQTLALTNMNVEYAQFGPKTLKDKQMAFTTLDLQFIELFPLTKEEIRNSRSRRISNLF